VRGRSTESTSWRTARKAKRKRRPTVERDKILEMIYEETVGYGNGSISGIPAAADRILAAIAAENAALLAERDRYRNESILAFNKIAEMEGEAEGLLATLPEDCVIRVREGGGPENLWAGLAVSVANTTRKVFALRAENAARDAAVRGLVEAVEYVDRELASMDFLPQGTTRHKLRTALNAYAEAAKSKEPTRG
jgi:hypothetical protein